MRKCSKSMELELATKEEPLTIFLTLVMTILQRVKCLLKETMISKLGH